jgi:hypothetical protein
VKTLNKIFVSSFVLSALLVTACSQKADDTKTRLRSGAVLGRPADGTSAGQLAAIPQNLAISVFSIGKTATADSSAWDVQSSVQIGNDTQSITTHNPTSDGVAQGQKTIGGVQLNISSYCANANCDVYYIDIDAYQNGTFLYQVGVLREFRVDGHDIYKVLSAGSQIQPDQMYQVLYNAYMSAP